MQNQAQVFIAAAVSADGFIGADASQSSLDWRSKEDGVSFTRLTRESGVMILGSTTYKTFRIKRAPPGRRLLIYTHHPEAITGEGVETTAEDPKALIDQLVSEGYYSIAVCGGSQINSLFLDAGLVTDLYLTIEPVLFGKGVPLFHSPMHSRLTLVENTPLNANTILLHYRVGAKG